MILFLGALDWVLRSQLKPGHFLAHLKEDCIESSQFSGKQKTFYWKDIASACIEINGNLPVLQLQLRPETGLADRRSFWTGRNQARPYFSLAPFSAMDQERLLEGVLQRLRPFNPHASTTNSWAQERVFAAELIALAPWTWVTYALVCTNVGVWLAMLAQGADTVKPSVEMLLDWGGNGASEVQRGQLWRMVSATFLHAGIVHLGINMLGLWSIGKTVERIYGHRVFLMIYLGSAIAGSAFSLHFSVQKAVSVGASGAVFGIAGALLVAVYKNRQTLPKIFGKQNLTAIGFFVFYSLLQGFAHRGIDNGAHVGGLLAGCLMACILPERFDMQRHAATLTRRTMAAFAVTVVLSVSMALSAPPAQLDMQRFFAGVAALTRGTQRFDDATRLTQQLHSQVKAGQMSEAELDEKSRTALAPAYRAALAELSQAWLPPEDPRAEFLQVLKHLTEVLNEALSMASVVTDGNSQPVPADPARAEVLNAETIRLTKRLQEIANTLKKSEQSTKR